MSQTLQTVFLDTDVMLDYLEKRHLEVWKIIADLLTLHKKERIRLVTSVFNIAELIDKEFEIHFNNWCLKNKMSSEEILNKRTKDKLFKPVSERNKSKVKRRVKSFIFKNRMEILSLSEEAEDYREIYDLIYQLQIRSQDALIVATALRWKVTYFLSNDDDLVKKIVELIDAYRLRDKALREEFRNSVMEAI